MLTCLDQSSHNILPLDQTLQLSSSDSIAAQLLIKRSLKLLKIKFLVDEKNIDTTIEIIMNLMKYL